MPIRRPTVEPAMPRSGSYEINGCVNHAEIMRELLRRTGEGADLPQEAISSIQSSGVRVSSDCSPITRDSSPVLGTALYHSQADHLADQLIVRISELENRLHLAGEYLAESAILRCRRCRGYPVFSEKCRNMARCVARDWAEEAVRIIGISRVRALHDQSEFMTIPHPDGPEERHFEPPF